MVAARKRRRQRLSYIGAFSELLKLRMNALLLLVPGPANQILGGGQSVVSTCRGLLPCVKKDQCQTGATDDERHGARHTVQSALKPGGW